MFYFILSYFLCCKRHENHQDVQIQCLELAVVKVSYQQQLPVLATACQLMHTFKPLENVYSTLKKSPIVHWNEGGS